MANFDLIEIYIYIYIYKFPGNNVVIGMKGMAVYESYTYFIQGVVADKY